MHDQVTDETADGFWERRAARTSPAGALTTIESPRTVGWVVTGALTASTTFALVLAFVFFEYGEPLSGWLTLGLGVAYALTWVWHAATGNVVGPAVFALVASVINEVAVHIVLGGYANSGAYLFWGVSMAFALAMMLGRVPAVIVSGLYVVLALVFGFLESSLSAGRSAPPEALSSVLFTVVFIGNVLIVTSILVYYLTRLSFERQRAERLLLNVLPEPVVAELKEHGRTRAKRFESVSVLFADIVGFTTMSAGIDPEELVDQLNQVFTHFDGLTEHYGCEKIRTIGDAYMVACGVPVPRDDHAHVLASMALDMLEYSRQEGLTFRIGINSGPVVAGVIGTSKFQYDVWGDTVNTASRMESHGQPGRIQVSEDTYRLIGDAFECSPRGTIEVKGKGELSTWFLESRAEAARSTV